LSLLWVQSHDVHSRHRNILQENFSMSSLRDFQPTITQHIDLLLQRMRERAGQTVDIARWFNYTTFDIIGSLTFGEPFGCLQEARYHPWIAFIFSRMKTMMFSQIILTMGWFGKVVDWLVPTWVKQEALAHVRLTKDKVDRRRSSRPKTPDFMTRMLNKVDIAGGLSLAELYADSQVSKGRSQRVVPLSCLILMKSLGQVLIMAGSETSATALAVAIYYLLRERHAMAKVTEEIRRCVSESDITFESLATMPYLRAVVNEALRSKSWLSL
jgi:cytochrome P450